MTVLYRPSVARAIALVAAAYMLFYVYWRATATLNSAALVFSLVVLAAEAQGVVSFLLFTFMTWDVGVSAPFRLLPDLRVDVYIPTYNEPLDVLEATLAGCCGITYPHTAYVLDDGRRPAVAALADRFGCRYLTRETNQHAKAGNLNAALPRTEGDFIVILDADMVPQPDFLDWTLGYFVDERVALVQLPQEFYNLDSIQHVRSADGSETWHEQSLFYRVIQPGKNRWNAAFWCGSPSVVRRAALESVGGVATESITEDLLTSIRLHGRGWRTLYHDEVLAYGIAPQTLNAFTVQRLRWAQGTMQILRSRENPLVARGLTLAQRLNYLASMATYFDAFQKLIYLLIPALILFSGALPLRVGAASFLLRWVPYLLLGMLANTALGRGQFHYLRVERYNLLKMFTFLWATSVLVWPRRLRFRVTPKRFDDDVYARERRQVVPHAVLLLMLAAALILGVVNLVTHLAYQPQGADSRTIMLVTIFWALVAGGMLLLSVSVIIHRLYHRSSYRFPTQLPALASLPDGQGISVTVCDLSLRGAGVLMTTDDESTSPVSLALQLPDGPLTIESEVMHRRALGDGRMSLGVRFRELDDHVARRLLTFVYVTLPRSRTAGRLAEAPNPLPVQAYQLADSIELAAD